MDFGLTYRTRLDSGEWTDISPIVDSRQTTLVRNLCTTEFKSAKDTASFTVNAPGGAWDNLRSSLVSQLLAAASEPTSHVYVEIMKDSEALFVGVVDLSTVQVSTLKLAQPITLSCQDMSVVNLDNVPDGYVVLEDEYVSSIVETLLESAGYVVGEDELAGKPADMLLRAFVMDPDEGDTWRDYIDTLLFECGGYVLDCDPHGVMDIRRIPLGDDATTARLVDNWLIGDGVKTSMARQSADGVKLKWSTIAETAEGKKQVVYVADISREFDEEGIYKGLDIASGDVWPEDGMTEPTYLEYEAEFLDREYQSGQKKNVNKDLSLILVDNVEASITVWDEDGKQLTIDEAFDWPIPEGEDWADIQTNPTFYPTKAFLLMRNKTDATVNMTSMTLQGDCVYRDRINTMLVPALSAKPEEYESVYVYSSDAAKRLATFYYNMKRWARTTHQWSELGEVTLGEVVKIGHKAAEIGQAALVVGVTLSFVGTQVKSACTAISLGDYDEYDIKEWGDNNSLTSPGDAVLAVQDWYLSTDLYTGVTTSTPGWSATSTEGDGKYLWTYRSTTHTSGRVTNSTPVIISVNGEAKTVTGLSTEYALGNGTTVAPTEGWSPSMPTRTDVNQVTWQRTIITYSDGTSEVTDVHPVLSVLVQWAWGPDFDSPPSGDVWLWDGFMVFDGMFIGNVADNWQSQKPERPDGGPWYLWMRWSPDGGLSWGDPVCVTDIQRKMTLTGASQWNASRGIVVNPITLDYAVSRENAQEECQWAIECDEEAGIAFSTGGRTAVTQPGADTVSVVLSTGFSGHKFTIRATIAELSAEMTATVSDAGWEIEYQHVIGADEPFPKTAQDGKPLMVGDYCLKEDAEGGRTPYYVSSISSTGTATWTMMSENVSWKIASSALPVLLNDALKAPNTTESASIVNLFAGNFAAYNAFIQSLGAIYFKIHDGGAIFGGAYDRSGNNESGGKGFYLDWTGLLKAVEAYFEKAVVNGSFLCSDAEGIVMQTSLGAKGGSYPCSSKTRWAFAALKSAVNIGTTAISATYDGTSVTLGRFRQYISADNQGGGREKSLTFTAPFTGAYRVSYNYYGLAYIQLRVNGNLKLDLDSGQPPYGESSYIHLEMEAGDSVSISCEAQGSVMETSKATVTVTAVADCILMIPSGSETAQYVFWGNTEYYLKKTLTCTGFDSSQHVDLASVDGWAQGTPTVDEIYTCVSGQAITVDGESVGIIYCVKRTDRLDIMSSAGNMLSFSFAQDEDITTTGWYDIAGTIQFMAMQRGLYTGSLLAIDDESLIGTADKPYSQGNIKIINATTVTATTHYGNVNEDGTKYKVWGAVAN